MSLLTRSLLTLLGTSLAVLFTFAVLCWLIVYVAFASVRWLATGQKPQVLLMWQQIQAMRKGMQAGRGASGADWSPKSDGRWRGGGVEPPQRNHDVVTDAVVREIHPPRNLPLDGP